MRAILFLWKASLYDSFGRAVNFRGWCWSPFSRETHLLRFHGIFVRGSVMQGDLKMIHPQLHSEGYTGR
jgi:hypothetical protein